jgi:hypothetical protein
LGPLYPAMVAVTTGSTVTIDGLPLVPTPIWGSSFSCARITGLLPGMHQVVVSGGKAPSSTAPTATGSHTGGQPATCKPETNASDERGGQRFGRLRVEDVLTNGPRVVEVLDPQGDGVEVLVVQ